MTDFTPPIKDYNYWRLQDKADYEREQQHLWYEEKSHGQDRLTDTILPYIGITLPDGFEKLSRQAQCEWHLQKLCDQYGIERKPKTVL